METLKINISHIKNIKKAELEVPFDNGILFVIFIVMLLLTFYF